MKPEYEMQALNFAEKHHIFLYFFSQFQATFVKLLHAYSTFEPFRTNLRPASQLEDAPAFPWVIGTSLITRTENIDKTVVCITNLVHR